MLCADARVAHVAALIGGRGYVTYRVERNDELCGFIRSALEAFWVDHVLSAVAPQNVLASPETYKRLRRQPDKTVDVPLEAIDEWKAAKEQRWLAGARWEDACLALYHVLGDAEGGAFPGGEVTYMKQKRKAFTVNECEYRVLRVKESKRD
jgi:hypothetical protein